MISKALKKNHYVDKILQEEATIIKMMQLQVVNDWQLEDKTGNLREKLKGHFSLQDFDGGPRLTLTYVKYMRFLDMPWVVSRRRGLLLYNRIVFGRIYNNTYLRVRAGYRESVQEEIDEMMRESTEPLNIET
ncbi:MAG: hypothetical protein LBP56_05220 [Odoribacteraceae bacterium]|jgi:hypothetical protein|nr:hypothetical protein [Odoribacteraceae bacterium]